MIFYIHVIPFVPLDISKAERAIETAGRILKAVIVGPPLVRKGPGGEVHVDVPLLYDGEAVDRVHFDPEAMVPSPKGRPVRTRVSVDPDRVKAVMESVMGECRVLDAAEFRDPEDAWAVPVAWRNIIIAHIKVAYDGAEFVPDLALTAEVRRNVP